MAQRKVHRHSILLNAAELRIRLFSINEWHWQAWLWRETQKDCRSTATWAPWCINEQLVSQRGVLQEWTLALQSWIWILVLLTCVWFCLSRVNGCTPLLLSMAWEHLHRAQLPFTGRGWHYPDWFSQQPEIGGKWPFSFCVWGDWALKRPLPARCQVSQKVHLSLCLFIHRVVETVKVS